MAKKTADNQADEIKSVNFYNLWLKIIDKFSKKFKNQLYIENLLHLPHIMRHLSATNSFENQSWKISILITNKKNIENLFIGKIKIEDEAIEKPKNINFDLEVNKVITNFSKYLNIDTTLNTLEPLARLLKLDSFLKYIGIDNTFNAKFESIKQHLTLNSLNDQKFKKYYFLLGSESILNFSFNGNFIGTATSLNAHDRLIKLTKHSNSIGIIIEGPFNKIIKYYIDGKFVLLDVFKDGKWLSIPSESIVEQISKHKNNEISVKSKYKIAEALSEMIIRRSGTMVIFADQERLKKDKTILTIANIQLFQNAAIDEIPFSNFIQLLNTDGAVIISNQGKLIFSGVMIGVTSEFLIHSKTTGYGARHLVFKYLQYLGYNVLMVSEEGEIYPNIIKVYSD
ncbi:MAG: diadenylate cyclase [Candidatus Marsarchaeota archaeon]|nr:diadenylate cyclase [Candidatus Marsarchaeota archaeon]MCL5094541.1 diadenylate cyclase [Candidatus Marsarchaeota archaeon]